MNLSATPVPNPMAVLREEFDEWALLFNPDTADVFGINPVGVAVWKLLDGTRDVSQVAAFVRDAFEGAPETVAAEVAAFLTTLEERGFVGHEMAREQ